MTRTRWWQGGGKNEKYQDGKNATMRKRVKARKMVIRVGKTWRRKEKRIYLTGIENGEKCEGRMEALVE